ncbi:MAG: hypothetical protein ACRCTD_08600, partial [Beijerinckiaceae bacterium]
MAAALATAPVLAADLVAAAADVRALLAVSLTAFSAVAVLVLLTEERARFTIPLLPADLTGVFALAVAACFAVLTADAVLLAVVLVAADLPAAAVLLATDVRAGVLAPPDFDGIAVFTFVACVALVAFVFFAEPLAGIFAVLTMSRVHL